MEHIHICEFSAYYVAKLIRRLHRHLAIPPERFQLIGHSLGAHVVGFTGKHVKRVLKNAHIGVVTGLDPANDDFSFDPTSENGIQKTDADLVAVIHADDTGYGARGHIDFYPNGGSHPQPGCDTNRNYKTTVFVFLFTQIWFAVCSHMLAPEFFNEALQNPESAFLAKKCDSYEAYLSGACDGNEEVTLGGNLEGHEGGFYFETNAEPPYSKS